MISQFGSEICLESKILFCKQKSVNEVRRTICDVINLVSNTCELETETENIKIITISILHSKITLLWYTKLVADTI